MILLLALALAQDPLPEGARLAFEEDWSAGIKPDRWYALRKKWGDGNHGVVPENVRIVRDDGRPVLECVAHGDRYDGPVKGLHGRVDRVGGVLVSKPFFASGRFEVAMKVGSETAVEGNPADPRHPKGTVPAIWTFAYRWVQVPKEKKGEFVPAEPLYNPHMPAYGIAANEYWSELDFPEYGKDGDFTKAMYNTFCQNRHEPKMHDVGGAADGRWHTYVTDWRTHLVPAEGIRDAQVVEHEGFWWIRDKSVPFDRYLGNPLKRAGPDRYLLYAGSVARHWIDGRKVAENDRFVPCMAAQLNIGVWLPNWAGPAPWKTSSVRFGRIRVWQFGDAGDVRGVLTRDIDDNMDKDGRPLK